MKKISYRNIVSGLAAAAVSLGLLGSSITALADTDTTGDMDTSASAQLTVDGGTFTNEYTPDAAVVDIELYKILHDESGSGRELEDGEFEFILIDEEGQEVARTTNDGEGNVVFSDLTFTKTGTYTYEAYESESDLDGITCDSTSMTITVTVTWNSEQDALVANVQYPEDSTFDNYYTAEAAELYVTATKTLTDSTDTGRELEEGEFTFELLDEDGNVLATAVNDADGNIAFDAVSITKTGTYTWQVVEVKGTDSHITYDETVNTITFTVTNEDGQLVITKGQE